MIKNKKKIENRIFGHDDLKWQAITCDTVVLILNSRSFLKNVEARKMFLKQLLNKY